MQNIKIEDDFLQARNLTKALILIADSQGEHDGYLCDALYGIAYSMEAQIDAIAAKKPIVPLVKPNELVADDVVKTRRIWRDGGETIVDADHLNPLFGGRKCNELQVSGVNGVNKIGSYCIRRLFFIDAVFIADRQFYTSLSIIHYNGKVLDLRRLIDADD